MIAMNVLGFAHDSTTETPVVVLRQNDGETVLPIWIGQAEALAIASAVSDDPPVRPLAHDLLIQAVTELGGKVIGFAIVALKEGTYYGALDILCERTGTLATLDCRPSDGLALALRAQVPIVVDETVITAAALERRRNERPGDFLEQLSQQKTDAPAKKTPDAGQHVDEDARLSALLQSLEPVSKRVM